MSNTINPKHIKPRGDNVFVELDTKPGSSPGGIALPDSVRQRQQDRFGTILSLGPDAPDDLKPGQRCVVNFFEGTNCTLDPRDPPERYKVLPAENVKALVLS